MPQSQSKPIRHACHWTPEEKNVLTWAWSTQDLHNIAMRLGRTDDATYRKAAKLGLTENLDDSLSLSQLVRKSGFSVSAVRTAMARVGVVLRVRARRTPEVPGVVRSSLRYQISAEKAELVLAELKKHSGHDRMLQSFGGEWGTGGKPEACLLCGRADRPHRSRGRCSACASRLRRQARGIGAPPGYVRLVDVTRQIRRSARLMKRLLTHLRIAPLKKGRIWYVREEEAAVLVELATTGGRYLGRRLSVVQSSGEVLG